MKWYGKAMANFIDDPERNADLAEWLEYGKKQGWIIPQVVCNTHDGTPMTPTEQNQFEEGEDPCIHVIRIFESEEEQKQCLEHW